MTVHEYVNDTKDIQVRLRYSNGPLLQRLKVLWVDEDPPADNQDFTETADEVKEKPKSPYGTFQLTEDGAWLMPYEGLISPEPIEINPHHWPWRRVKEELDKLAALGSSYKGRRLYLLYDPATGRTNGTNPNPRTFTNPLKMQGPDPWLQYYNGFYYLATTTWNNTVTMRRATTLRGLASATDQVLYTMPAGMGTMWMIARASINQNR